jgi:hypothetical protein
LTYWVAQVLPSYYLNRSFIKPRPIQPSNQSNPTSAHHAMLDLINRDSNGKAMFLPLAAKNNELVI